MSDAGKAVFLSYASQDAEAAKKICDALRAAGVEVWFDQSELVGGDAWDAKIRKQIKECALLIPVVSAATQARTEGYFRLEWRLADQRTHLMAKGRLFLLPVVIDDTRDADAQVPDSFSEVQWTRLPGGETPSAFCARVKRLLDGNAPVATASPRDHSEERSQQESRHKAAPATKRRQWLAAGIGAVVTVAALAIWQPWRTGKPLPKLAAADAPSDTTQSGGRRLNVPPEPSEARKLVARVWEQLNKTALGRAELQMADRLCRQAAELDSNDADVWAAWSQVDTWYGYSNLERTPARREGASSKATRALQIAPESYEARLAQACFLVREEPHGKSIFADEAERQLRQLLEERPDEPRVLFALGILLRNGLRFEEGAQVFDRLARQPAFTATALSEKGYLRQFQGDLQAAGECAEQSIAVEPFYGNLALKAIVAMNWYGNLDQARDAIESMPAVALLEDFGAGAAFGVYWRRREPEKMLRILRTLPQEWLSSNNFSGPKSYYVGMAYQMAGRMDAARAEWRTALEALNHRLQSEPNVSGWHLMKARLLVWLANNAEAVEHFQLAHDFGGDAQRITVDLVRKTLLGDTEGAIELLDQAAKDGRNWATGAALKTNPTYDPLRADPRFQALLARVEADPRLTPQAMLNSPADRSQVDNKSVAVLAFANLSDDKANEYFSDGISEELLNVLAKVPGLKVSARTSAFYFKGKEVPVPEIAKQLGVAYVVEGSVRKQGDKVRITAQLIKAADGFHVWSDTFTRDLKDIFAVQDEIAGLIAKNLELKMGMVAATRTVDPEAYRLYLEALPAITSRTFAGFDRAEQLIIQAIARDPGLVPAQAALAIVWGLRAQQRGELDDPGSPVARRIVAQAEMAVRLGADWAEAQAACGFGYSLTLRFDEAEPFLRRAIQLNPSYASAHLWLGRNLLAAGRMAEALKALRQATELDPFSHRALDNYAFALVDAGQPQDALEFIERALRIQPDSVQALLIKAEILARTGRVAEALAIAERYATVESHGNVVYTIEVFALAGRGATLEGLLTGSPPLHPLDRFVALVALGRNEEALTCFSQARINWGAIDIILFNPQLDPIRREPAFLAKLRESGLTEAHDRAQAWRAAHPPEKPEAKP